MINDCFYYSVPTPDGNFSLISDRNFEADKKILLDGQSPAVKQQIFGFVKNELTKRSVPYTDLCCASGSAGIFCSNLRFIITDRGASFDDFSLLSLSDFQNSEQINESDVNDILGEKQAHIRRAERFFSACRLIKNDTQRLESTCLNRKKTEAFTNRLWQKVTRGMNGKIGSEYRRLVTCPTADGIELNMAAFDRYCEKLIVIKDRTGAVSELITDRLRRYALGSGYGVISCPCCLDASKTEHLIIPALSFGVFTSKHYHRDDFPHARKIYAKRFLSRSVENIKQRTEFSLKAYRSLMNEAFDSLKKVDDCDRRLDGIIYESTDFSKLNKTIADLIF